MLTNGGAALMASDGEMLVVDAKKVQEDLFSDLQKDYLLSYARTFPSHSLNHIKLRAHARGFHLVDPRWEDQPDGTMALICDDIIPTMGTVWKEQKAKAKAALVASYVTYPNAAGESPFGGSPF